MWSESWQERDYTLKGFNEDTLEKVLFAEVCAEVRNHTVKVKRRGTTAMKTCYQPKAKVSG